jgi:fructokinase
MVSVGVIDWILNRIQSDSANYAIEDLLGGVVAGQRLAAANCAFAGARGLFLRHGPHLARLVLDDNDTDMLSQLELFDYGLE